MDPIIIYILGVITIATIVRSTFGFGESLIAVPLLIIFIPVEVAVPLSVLVSITIAGMILIQDYKLIHFNSAKWLLIFGILGIPIGVLLLISGSNQIVKFILGLLIISYSLYALFGKRTFKLETDNMRWLFSCGFFSGIFGGAYGLNGPPLILYGDMRRWSAQYFRATLQAYFLPSSMVGMLGYWYSGLWSVKVTQYYFMTIPLVIPAVFLGRFFNQLLKDNTFFKYVYMGLIAIGIILIIQAVI